MPCNCDCHKSEIDLEKVSEELRVLVELPPKIQFYEIDGKILFPIKSDGLYNTGSYMVYFVDNKNRKAGVELNITAKSNWPAKAENGAKALAGYEL